MAQQIYAYRPLEKGEVRVLTLFPATNGIHLEIDIHHIKLSDHVERYETLSYTWGDTKHSELIKCREAFLKAGKNLVTALKALRHQNNPRVLWIDAICINQVDDVERAQQVAIMAQIYQSAAKTIVHLGDETEDSFVALTFIRDAFELFKQRVANHINRSRDQSSRPPSPLGVRFPFPNPTDEEEELANDKAIYARLAESMGEDDKALFSNFGEERTLRALAHLMARPWFRRAWVIQEFVVSRELDFMCGKTSINENSFAFIFGNVFRTRHIDWQNFVPTKIRQDFYHSLHQISAMESIRSDFQGKDANKTRLAYLLQQHRLAQCARPQDKIYSLSGISRMHADVTPDYHAPVAETYLNVAISLINQGDGHDVLKQACVSDSTIPNLPSWVPDWSAPTQRTDYSRLISSPSNWWFQAGRPAQDRLPRNDRTKIIRSSSATPSACTVNVIPLVRITKVGTHDPTHVPDCPNLSRAISVLGDALTHFRNLFPTTEVYPPTGEHLDYVLDAICRVSQPMAPPSATTQMQQLMLAVFEADKWTMMSGREFEFSTVDEHPPTPHQTGDRLNIPRLVNILREDKENDPTLHEAHVRAVAGRRFAMMEGWYAGLVPDKTRENDWIVLLRDGNVPLVLREIDDSSVQQQQQQFSSYEQDQNRHNSSTTGTNSGSGGSSWRLIGDCYVHGIMHGEVFENGMASERGGWRDITIY